MRVVTALLPLLIAASPVEAAEECDLEALKTDIRWCLIEAPEDTPGRQRMIDALHREGTTSDIYFFRAGYGQCHDVDQEKLRNFTECRREDPIALFNYGRMLIDLPPVSTGS